MHLGRLVSVCLGIFVLFSVGCSGGGGDSDSRPGNGNNIPIANAGNDQNISSGSMVNLNGSGSMDADGDLLSFSWSFESRPEESAATLMDAESPTPTFIADVPGEYIAQLVVDDGENTSRPSNVSVNASAGNSAPVANAGNDQNVSVGEMVRLDGMSSSDSDGDSISANWVFISRPTDSATNLTNPDSFSPSFTADVTGDYTIELVVNDGEANSESDRVIVSATIDNNAPTANAGFDRNVDTGIVVTLDGSESSDADGNSLRYTWAFVSMPTSSTASLTNVSTVNPAFTPDVDGDYVISLVVDDGMKDSQPDQVLVTARQPGSGADITPPTVEFIEVLNSPINVSSGNAIPQVRVRLRDDISGVDGDILGLTSPSGNQTNGLFITPNGNPTDFEGTLTGSAFSQNSETGTWRVSSVIVSDEAGNSDIISGADLAGRGFDIELEVEN